MVKIESPPSERAHEGRELRQLIRRSGFTQDDFAALLGMSRQNLGYHMRKDKLDDDFRRLLKEKGIALHGDHLPKKMENNLAQSGEEIPYNIPLKKQRMAKVILPKESKGSDIDTIIEHLELMKKSLD